MEEKLNKYRDLFNYVAPALDTLFELGVEEAGDLLDELNDVAIVILEQAELHPERAKDISMMIDLAMDDLETITREWKFERLVLLDADGNLQ